MSKDCKKLNNYRVLVMDDFQPMQEVLAEMLGTFGVKGFNAVACGRKGLDLLQSGDEPFDLLLIDWNMPEISGLEVLKFCRQSPHYRHVPIVMITGESELRFMADAAQEGADGYILKPFTVTTLEKQLGHAIQARLVKKSGS